MPTPCSHSRSLRMPCSLTFPSSQCHQTRGFAVAGGFSKPATSGSVVWLKELVAGIADATVTMTHLRQNDMTPETCDRVVMCDGLTFCKEPRTTLHNLAA